MADKQPAGPEEQLHPSGAQVEAGHPARHPSPENPEVARELGDVNVKAILWFAAGLVAFAVVLHLGLAWMYFAFRAAEDREKGSAYPEEFSADTPRLPKGTRLEGIEGRKEDVGGERAGREAEVSREEDADRYRWVDEEKGIVSIPIDQAFERLLSKKPKARGDREAKKYRDRGTDVPPHDASSGRRPEEER